MPLFTISSSAYSDALMQALLDTNPGFGRINAKHDGDSVHVDLPARMMSAAQFHIIVDEHEGSGEEPEPVPPLVALEERVTAHESATS